MRWHGEQLEHHDAVSMQARYGAKKRLGGLQRGSMYGCRI